jgi:hypothetical protein
MEQLFKTIHNVETGEITQVELTAEDLAVMAEDELEAQAIKTAIAEAATNKAAILARLGITEEEARLLLS